jgi:hypothetical protein
VFHEIDLETGLGRELARIDAPSWSKGERRWALSDE